MSYSKIRTYFNQQIQTFDPDMKEWRDALVFEDVSNIPSTLLGTRYHLEIGPWTSTPAQDKSVHDEFTVILTIFSKGFTDPLTALDNLLDEALCIKHQLINPVNIEAFKTTNGGQIDAVENVSGEPSEIASTNDNIIKIALEFNVRMYFGVIQ